MEIPNNNNLRPIIVNSVFVKLVEGILLLDSKHLFYENFAEHQLGFVPKMCCKVHIQRLIHTLKHHQARTSSQGY